MEPTSPKGHDLRLRHAYALHCHVPDILGTAHGEFLLNGRAEFVEVPEERRRAVDAFVGIGFSEPPDRYVVYRLTAEEAIGTSGGDAPQWLRWRAPINPSALFAYWGSPIRRDRRIFLQHGS